MTDIKEKKIASFTIKMLHRERFKKKGREDEEKK